MKKSFFRDGQAQPTHSRARAISEHPAVSNADVMLMPPVAEACEQAATLHCADTTDHVLMLTVAEAGEEKARWCDGLLRMFELLGSIEFLVGSALFYPQDQDSCPKALPCPRLGAMLFICGSVFFALGSSVTLCRACVPKCGESEAAKSGQGFRQRRRLPDVGTVLSFVAGWSFTVGSVYFIPAVAAVETSQAGDYLFIIGCLLFSLEPSHAFAE